MPRKAKEAIGAIARLTATDGSGKAMTVSQNHGQLAQRCSKLLAVAAARHPWQHRQDTSLALAHFACLTMLAAAMGMLTLCDGVLTCCVCLVLPR